MIVIKNRKKDAITKNSVFVHRGYVLGNPFPCWPISTLSRDECIEKYREWFYDKVKQYDTEVIKVLKEIRSKHLAGETVELVCYCSPLKCHAEIIKEFVENNEI